MVQGSGTGEVLHRVREEEREWPSRHGPSCSDCVDRDTCGMNISPLRGNSCNLRSMQSGFLLVTVVMVTVYLSCSSREMYQERIRE